MNKLIIFTGNTGIGKSSLIYTLEKLFLNEYHPYLITRELNDINFKKQDEVYDFFIEEMNEIVEEFKYQKECGAEDFIVICNRTLIDYVSFNLALESLKPKNAIKIMEEFHSWLKYLKLEFNVEIVLVNLTLNLRENIRRIKRRNRENENNIIISKEFLTQTRNNNLILYKYLRDKNLNTHKILIDNVPKIIDKVFY